MKTKFVQIVVALTLTSLFSVPVFSQNLNKEEEYLKKLSLDTSKHIYADFLLNEFDYKQDIGFGSNINVYNDYKKNFKTDKSGEKIVINKHRYFNSVEYRGSTDGILNNLRLEFDSKNYSVIKEKLNSLFGKPDEESYEHLGQSIYFVPNKFYIVLSSKTSILSEATQNGFLRIESLDFLKNTSKYDEFTKVGMIYFDKTPITRRGSATYIEQYFVFCYDKKDNFKGFAIKTNYTGKEWLFMKKIDYLLDNDEVLSIEIEPNRKTETLIRITDCKENDIHTIDIETIDKLLNSKTVKVRVRGENHYIDFKLTPLHKYQILTAKYYYENDLF